MRAQLAGEKVGLMVIDADGFPGLTLADYSEFLEPGCLLVIDDYLSEDALAGVKALTTKRQVDRCVERKELERIDVLPFGTWFGRFLKPVRSYTLGLIYASREGKAFVERVPLVSTHWSLSDSLGNRYATSSAEDVISIGNGRYLVSAGDGAFIYFAPPGNPSELAGDFELIGISD